VNVAFRDGGVARAAARGLRARPSHSREITLDDWQHRLVWEKLIGSIAWILERQQ
jgi:hypothetical protein